MLHALYKNLLSLGKSEIVKNLNLHWNCVVYSMKVQQDMTWIGEV